MALRSLALAASLALGTAVLAAAPTAVADTAAGSTTTVVTTGRDAGTVRTALEADEQRRASYSTRLARAMNATRRDHDLRPLKVRTPCLTDFARDWARHLARTGKFEHQDLGPILRRCKLSRVGEILAKGSVTPKQMIRMWLDSPGHRRLLLDPGFRKAGVFAKRDRNGSWVGCIDFGRG